MKTLSLIPPENFKGDWDKLSKDILHRIHADLKVGNDEELCGVTLGDCLQTGELKALSVMVMGNDFPSSVLFLMKLRLKGDGQCPGCGSDDIQVVDDHNELDDEEAFAADYNYICNNCNKEWRC